MQWLWTVTIHSSLGGKLVQPADLRPLALSRQNRIPIETWTHGSTSDIKIGEEEQLWQTWKSSTIVPHASDLVTKYAGRYTLLSVYSVPHLQPYFGLRTLHRRLYGIGEGTLASLGAYWLELRRCLHDGALNWAHPFDSGTLVQFWGEKCRPMSPVLMEVQFWRDGCTNWPPTVNLYVLTALTFLCVIMSIFLNNALVQVHTLTTYLQ